MVFCSFNTLVSGQLCLVPTVSAYERFDCTCFPFLQEARKWILASGRAGQRVVSTVAQACVFALAHAFATATVKETHLKCPLVTEPSVTVSFPDH